MPNCYAAITSNNIVCGVYLWDGVTPWLPPPYQEYSDEGLPIGDPQPTTVVPNTEPSTAKPGDLYDPVTNTFTALG
ncbi:hypothetical protein UFOVP1082_52 [uncultured Caudovirales phage]|uniref:Uncharacterized protein n=1 Tax=uncultured Caudovirales phage TaxID=2100421 RepID=A0A6J5SH68_9CAUD|nr:hypothetical protein UFOVP906_30 [uncultured Caudovirales phage]CAB4176725.1 hypothetical protein UFOVP992_56 [uncultured Caudovirales phage]CAB4183452.1 hypothetical protein UFOVP1082_52 [uncultured Caudovirales phage]CAB4197714.1 hypothetical protein UFOVP1322_37 [uncultured Caudovirales phage]CAB4213015.1 hypothetical protein UFOVP1434_59 [uncultured Caudovirales phage]